jgi:hypothetical protein
MRCSWDDVLAKPAIAFLNVLGYRRDKRAREDAALEQWKLKH